MRTTLPLSVSVITCVMSLAQTVSGVIPIATLDYSPGEFQGFGANTHAGATEGESTGPFTISNIDDLGLSLTVSGSAPVITEFIGNSSFPAAFLLGDVATAAVTWELDANHVVDWVEFDFRYLSGGNDQSFETFSDFIGSGANISSIKLTNESDVTWDGSVLLPSEGDGRGTMRIEFETPATGFGWTYNVVGEPAGAGIIEMRLAIEQVPEPSAAGLLLIGGTLSLAHRRGRSR